MEDQATLQENAGRETAEGCLLEAAGVSPISVSPKRTIIVTTIKAQAANIVGQVGNIQIEMLMDLGEILPLCNHISTQVCIQNVDAPVEHNFVVVDHLIAPVILRTDFHCQHKLILDF